MRELKINGIYKHYKGDLYVVEDIIYHSETGEKMVAYRALYGDNKLWCRPYEMFLDEVNKNEQKYRFEFQERFFEHELIREDIQFNSLIPELSVSNIDVSKNFYESIGFRVVYERTKDKFYFMQLENNQIMLEENNNNWNVGKMEYPYGNGINISMRLKDVQKKYEELKDKNIRFFLNLKIHEYEVNNKIYRDSEFLIQDPDGYLLRFNN